MPENDRTTMTVLLRVRGRRRWQGLVDAVRAVEGQGDAVGQLIVLVEDPSLLSAALHEWSGRHDVVPAASARSVRDAGVAHARHEVVALLDDTVRPAPGWAAAHLAAYRDPSVVGVGGPVRAAWDTGHAPAWFPSEFAWTVGCSFTGGPGAWQPVRILNGVNLSVRRDVLDAVGGFGTAPGAAALCRRILDAKPDMVLLHEPRAAVDRTVTSRHRGTVRFVRRCWSEGTDIARQVAHGQDDAVVAGRDHTMRVLPRGVLGGLRDGMTGDTTGFGRAAAVLAGFGATSAGYGTARARTAATTLAHDLIATGTRKGSAA